MAESNSRSEFGSSDETKIIYCEPCRKDQHLAIAEGYCLDCPEYLCGRCYKFHRNHKALENHRLLDKDSMPTASNVCVEKCCIHPDKVTEFFCETCDELGCQDCVRLDHHHCKNVKFISELAKDLDKSRDVEWFVSDTINTEQKLFRCDVEWFVSDIERTEQKLSETKDNLAKISSDYKQMNENAKKELKKQRAVINKLFDSLEKQMEDQIQAFEKSNKDMLNARYDRLDSIQKALGQIKNGIQAKKTGQTCQLFIAMKRGRPKLKTFDDELEEDFFEGRRLQRYTLNPSEQIQTLTMNISKMCSLETARLESEIKIKTEDRIKDIYIRSITSLRGHYCAVAASGGVLVLDTQSASVTSRLFNQAPLGSLNFCGITAVNDDQVAVSASTSNGNKIIFLSVSQSGILEFAGKQYPVKDTYFDMAYHNGTIYAPMDNQIHIINLEGEADIHVIQSDPEGGDLFGILNGIAISPDGNTFYVADSKNCKIFGMTLDGSVKAVFNDEILKMPMGIAVDNNGFVYVIDTTTSRIYRLSADLKQAHLLMEGDNGVKITYSRSENKLYTDSNNHINQYTFDCN